MWSFCVSSPRGVLDGITLSKPQCVTIQTEYCQPGKVIRAFGVQSIYWNLTTTAQVADL